MYVSRIPLLVSGGVHFPIRLYACLFLLSALGAGAWGCSDWHHRVGEIAAGSGDYEKAADRFLQAAEAGNPQAELQLGLLYYQGLGVEQDREAALYWLYQSAKGGNRYAQFRLGQMYEKGEGAPVNYKHAAYWYGLAIESGESLAEVALAELYLDGRGVERNRMRALRFFASAADAGNAHAQFKLAELYEQEGADGREVEELRRAAAKQEHALAQAALGRGFRRSGTAEYERAERWLRRAAGNGNAGAQHELAVMLVERGGRLEASRWLERAAKQDYTPAQVDLAESLTEAGRAKVAVELFRTAAMKGNAYAQFRLGEHYADGKGVEANEGLARAWLERAAAEIPGAARRLESMGPVEAAQRTSTSSSPTM